MGRGRQRLIGPRDGGRGDGTGAAAVDRAGGSEVAMENGKWGARGRGGRSYGENRMTRAEG
jgi:hypothetical protein